MARWYLPGLGLGLGLSIGFESESGAEKDQGRVRASAGCTNYQYSHIFTLAPHIYPYS